MEFFKWKCLNLVRDSAASSLLRCLPEDIRMRQGTSAVFLVEQPFLMYVGVAEEKVV